MTAQVIDHSAFSYVPCEEKPARPAVRAHSTGQLHLTRRGRLLFIGLPLMAAAACLVFALGFFNSPATAASDPSLQASHTITYTVGPGDTVWRIADVIAGEGDPRDAVQAIMELNQLESATIQVGQQLLLPPETSP